MDYEEANYDRLVDKFIDKQRKLFDDFVYDEFVNWLEGVANRGDDR
jgi:hypothetical protein